VGVIERVACGVHCEEIEFRPLGRSTLAAVDAVAGLDVSVAPNAIRYDYCNERRRRGAPELPTGARR
jgi:hypothetical protein